MFRALILASAAWLLLTSPTLHAAPFGTRAQAVTLVDRAANLLQRAGLGALKDAVNNRDHPDNHRFRDRDLYVIVIAVDGTIVAHGANPFLVGTDGTYSRDSAGNDYIRRMLDAARGPAPAWVDYVWINPVTGRDEVKSAYVRDVQGAYLVGVGVYSEHQGQAARLALGQKTPATD